MTFSGASLPAPIIEYSTKNALRARPRCARMGPPYQGSSIDPMVQSQPLDLALKASGARRIAAIRLLVTLGAQKIPTSKDTLEENH